MALAVRQIKISARASGTSLARAFDSAVLAGSLLLAHGSWFSAGSTASATFSDNVNGTWTAPGTTGYSIEVTDSWAEVASFPNSGAGTVTVTLDPPGTSSDNDLTLLEVTGAMATSPRDVSATNSATMGTGAATTSVVTGVLAQANELLVSSFSHTVDTRTLTEDTADGFSLADENENNTTGQCFNVQYKLVTSTASVTVNGSIGSGLSTGTWFTGVASYKEAAGSFVWPGRRSQRAMLLR